MHVYKNQFVRFTFDVILICFAQNDLSPSDWSVIILQENFACAVLNSPVSLPWLKRNCDHWVLEVSTPHSFDWMRSQSGLWKCTSLFFMNFRCEHTIDSVAVSELKCENECESWILCLKSLYAKNTRWEIYPDGPA